MRLVWVRCGRWSTFWRAPLHGVWAAHRLVHGGQRSQRVRLLRVVIARGGALQRPRQQRRRLAEGLWRRVEQGAPLEERTGEADVGVDRWAGRAHELEALLVSEAQPPHEVGYHDGR